MLSNESKELLVAASEVGLITTTDYISEVFKVLVNKRSFTENNIRSEALWKQALQDLCDYEFVSPAGKTSYEVTKSGFEAADVIKINPQAEFEKPNMMFANTIHVEQVQQLHTGAGDNISETSESSLSKKGSWSSIIGLVIGIIGLVLTLLFA